MTKKTIPTHNNRSSAGFEDTMRQAQSHMTPSARIFSRFIHLGVVEFKLELLSRTLFRPIPLLTGSLFAIIAPLGIWAVAKYYGYGLSGSETMISFIFGWFFGLILDYLKALISGKSDPQM